MRNHILFFFCFISLNLFGQAGDGSITKQTLSSDDEKSFYAETKQVNQFLRRFNGEEDIKGVKLSPDDPLWRDPEYRKKFITGLFDEQDQRITNSLKKAFINDVTSVSEPKFLEFNGNDWFGETYVKFDRGSSEVFVTLFMKLVRENLGSKWVIDDVFYTPYEDLYKKDESSANRFLHPLSHELDFMNLDKVFGSGIHTGDYFKQDFTPDKLSVFLYELSTNRLKYKYVSGVKFHFFQIPGWYFEITEFNRPGMNRGWLISNLIRLENGQKEDLKNFILHRD